MFKALFPGFSADFLLPQQITSGITPSLSGLAALDSPFVFLHAALFVVLF